VMKALVVRACVMVFVLGARRTLNAERASSCVFMMAS